MNENFYKIFISVIVLIIVSRLVELYISAQNEAILKNKFRLNLVHPFEHKVVIFFHICWFLSLSIEALLVREVASQSIAILCYTLLIVSHVLRMESMFALKEFWTAKIFRLNTKLVVNNGIYKYFYHPSYLAVVIEFIALPLLFSANYTLIIFSIINLIIIINRVLMEKDITGRYI